MKINLYLVMLINCKYNNLLSSEFEVDPAQPICKQFFIFLKVIFLLKVN